MAATPTLVNTPAPLPETESDSDEEEEDDEEDEDEEEGEEAEGEMGCNDPKNGQNTKLPHSSVPLPAVDAETEGATSSTAQAAAADISSVTSEASTLQSQSTYSVDTSTPLSDQLDLRLWEAAFRHHCRLFTGPKSVPLAPHSIALQVHVQEVDGLRLTADNTESAYAANLTLYHTGSHTFFGRTYTTETASLVPGPNGLCALRFDCHLLWHTRLRDADVKLVIEVFALSTNAAQAHNSRRGLGWAMVEVDLPTFHDHTAASNGHSLQAWCPLFAGTPRLLVGSSPPFPHRGSAQALVRISTSQAPRWTQLLPLDILMGSSAPVPGLKLQAGSVTLDPVLRLTVAQIAITLPAGYESQLVAQMAASQCISHCVHVTHRLRMTIHTTQVVIGRPQEVELTEVGNPLPGHPLTLGFQGSLQFDGFLHHRYCALLFELIYELVTQTGENGIYNTTKEFVSRPTHGTSSAAFGTVAFRRHSY
eukprot:GGOE01055111.1.p1 GENE.GGOE01055111.1~~GGOE01055111.1.p1  ORF type:complete len:525 (+),score=129.18 GGOE01055111.1:143-1576(+)